MTFLAIWLIAIILCFLIDDYRSYKADGVWLGSMVGAARLLISPETVRSLQPSKSPESDSGTLSES